MPRWLADDRNPLTPRVIVNRLWHYHFGQGLVATPSDFGYNGERPSHPALLDHLAQRLLAHHWRLKPLHKEILLSAAYQQASTYNPLRPASMRARDCFGASRRNACRRRRFAMRGWLFRGV